MVKLQGTVIFLRLSCIIMTEAYDMNMDDIEIVEFEEDGNLIRLFMCEGGMQSATYINADLRNELVFNYMQSFAKLSVLHPDASDILVLGAGTFSYPKYVLSHCPDARVDAVDPEEDLFTFACSYFYLDQVLQEYDSQEEGRLAFIADEGRHYLDECEKKYDIIINDAFNGMEPVADLCTKEAAQSAKAHLNEKGMYLLNLPGYENPDESEYLRSMIHTLRQVFSCVCAVRVKGDFAEGDSMNYVVMASDCYDNVQGEVIISTEGAVTFTDVDPEAVFDTIDWM